MLGKYQADHGPLCSAASQTFSEDHGVRPDGPLVTACGGGECLNGKDICRTFGNHAGVYRLSSDIVKRPWVLSSANTIVSWQSESIASRWKRTLSLKFNNTVGNRHRLLTFGADNQHHLLPCSHCPVTAVSRYPESNQQPLSLSSFQSAS